MVKLVVTDTTSPETPVRSRSVGLGIKAARPGPKRSTVRLRYFDYTSIEQVLSFITSLSMKGAQSSRINEVAKRIGGAERTTSAKIALLFEWFRANVAYQLDPRNTEDIQSAERTLTRRAGDCEDHVILAATMMAFLGIGSRYVVIRQRGRSAWNHIYLQYWDKGWKNWDTGRPDPRPPDSAAPEQIIESRNGLLFQPMQDRALANLSGSDSDDTPVLFVPNKIRVSVLELDRSKKEITIEVNSWRITKYSFSFDCPHPTIAIRSERTGNLLSVAAVPGGIFELCVKQLTMRLASLDDGDRLIFEAYKEPGLIGGASIDDITTGRATPDLVSDPWKFDDVPVVEPVGSGAEALDSLASAAKWASVLGVLAVGTWALLPVITSARRLAS